jgi:hypothetical protein
MIQQGEAGLVKLVSRFGGGSFDWSAMHTSFDYVG